MGFTDFTMPVQVLSFLAGVFAVGSADALSTAAVASAERLLAKIEAERPEAEILRIQLRRRKAAGFPDWIYEVKLFFRGD